MRAKHSDFSGEKAEPRRTPSTLAELKAILCDSRGAEEKIALSLLFMKKTLSKPSQPRLRDFWDAKHLCVSLFKEPISSAKKNNLWSQYIELSVEARRLKETIDEQATFFIEQIELAIESLEDDFSNCKRLAQQVHPPKMPKNIEKWINNPKLYSALQCELHVLGTLAGRFSALRKEIIRIDHVRIGVKNRLLKHLAQFGDQLFPRRTELTNEISDALSRDVHIFAEQLSVQTPPTRASAPPFLRGEVQSFQALAKALTLNASGFSKIRSTLDTCWERVQEMERDRKREEEKRKKDSKTSRERLMPKIKAFETFCATADSSSKGTILNRASDLRAEILRFPLHRDDVKQLHEQVESVCGRALEKIEEAVKKQRQKQSGEVAILREELIKTLDREQNMSLDALFMSRKKLLASFHTLNLSEIEKQIFERQFSDLSSSILDKKEDILHSFEEWKECLEERRGLVKQLKEQVEGYRKEMGGSSLDFEKGMTYRSLYDSAKIRLGKAVKAMERLEEKITEEKL